MAARLNKQQRIIKNYYDNRGEIMMQSLSELVTDLYLAETDRKRDQLWKRAEKALRNMKVTEKQIAAVMTERSPEALAKFVEGRF